MDAAAGSAAPFTWPAVKYDAMREIRARTKKLWELVGSINSLVLPGTSLHADLKAINKVGCGHEMAGGLPGAGTC
jgi:hypothetical protein